jgi:membrane-associated protein
MHNLINWIPLSWYWVYAALFLLPFLECSLFIGMFIPGETMVVLAGFLAVHGYVDLGDCVWVAASGAVLGDSVGFFLGRVFGAEYFHTHEKLLFLKRKHVRSAEEYFKKHGGKTVFLGRFTAFLRAVTPFTAGLSRMPFGRFFAFNSSGGIIWSTLFLMLGYLFGESIKKVESSSIAAGALISTLIIIAVVYFARGYIVSLFRRLRKSANTLP